MDLFGNLSISDLNLLPKDRYRSFYYGKVFSQLDADALFLTLLNTIDWRNDEAFILGKHIVTKRKVAWYGDLAFSYTYSNATKYALPWTDALLALKAMVEALTH